MICRTCKSYPNCDGCNVDTLIKALENGKFDFDERHNVIIPDKVVHAKWLPMTNPIEWFDCRERFECSNCGIYHAPLKNERYCPYCGAKMINK